MKITQETIARIGSQTNLVLRNLQITQSYYHIARSLENIISTKNASWWVFGMHASKTAGHALRHETLPPLLKSIMIRAAGYENTFMYLDQLDAANDFSQEQHNTIASALNSISSLVSAGNLLIFEELAWLFIHYSNTFKSHWQRDDTTLHIFLDDHLTRGTVEHGGQDYLWEALTAYYDARFTTDAKLKAEHILKGNLLIGLHEQTRLQPYIEQAMAVPFDTLVPAKFGAGMQRIREMVSQATTTLAMSYSLPNKDLKLGQNVAAPTGFIQTFPPHLIHFEDARLREIIAWCNQGSNTLTGSAATNWGLLSERMRYIAGFFRAYQNYKPLFTRPFSKEQATLIEQGHIPPGSL